MRWRQGGLRPGGGHWPRKGVWGCAAVMTPFFQASRRSLAYQFTIIAPLLCPPFSNFRKIFNFQPCFGQNFSSQDANFPNFRSLDPSFFKENPLPRPYFWKPVWHIPTQKKVECPPGGSGGWSGFKILAPQRTPDKVSFHGGGGGGGGEGEGGFKEGSWGSDWGFKPHSIPLWQCPSHDAILDFLHFEDCTMGSY